jgi:hypothetical protein
MKGIKKKKKERMVVDENTDVVKPRYIHLILLV